MAVPGPPEPRRLSSHEEAALARIERDLLDDDPTLVRLAADRPSRIASRSPVSARDLALLVVILLVLVGTAILLPPAARWTVLPIVTGLLVVPWTVLCARRSTR